MGVTIFEDGANGRLNNRRPTPFNVGNAGASGDGQTDDYRAIKDASDSQGSVGGIYFPPGTYRVGTNLTVNCEAIFALGATLEPDAGVTVTLDKVTTAPGASIIASTALGTVSITGAVNGSGVLDVRTFGAVGDGVTDDTAALDRAAVAAVSAGMVVPPGTYAIASNLTITSPITFLPGAKIRPASGVTLTISGQVIVGPYQQIFDIAAGGTALITSRGATEVFVTWWGAAGNGSTDDTAEVQAAINCAWNVTGDTGSQVRVRVPKGAYLISSPLILGKNLQVWGDGGANFATQFVVAAAFSGGGLFRADGALVTGGFSFRNLLRGFLVDCSLAADSTVLPRVFDILTAYTITLDDIYIHNGVGVGVYVDDSNDVLIDRCKLFSRTSPRGTAGIETVGTSSVTVRECDIEVWTRGIYQREESKVTVLGGYAERNINQWECAGNASGSMTVVGGYWRSPGVSGIAGAIVGQNCTVIGGRYVANGGQGLVTSGTSFRNAKVFGATGDVQTIAAGDGSVSADRGNTDVTLVWQQDAAVQRFATTLTADRTVTLSTTNARDGALWRIFRPAGGNFLLNIGTGPLAVLGPSMWCEVAWDSATVAWRLVALGSLLDQEILDVQGLSVDVTLKVINAYTRMDATGANRTVVLPAAASNRGRVYTVKKIDASANTVTIDANGAETIDGAETYVLTAQYQRVTIVSNGTNWDIIST